MLISTNYSCIIISQEDTIVQKLPVGNLVAREPFSERTTGNGNFCQLFSCCFEHFHQTGIRMVQVTNTTRVLINHC